MKFTCGDQNHGQLPECPEAVQPSRPARCLEARQGLDYRFGGHSPPEAGDGGCCLGVLSMSHPISHTLEPQAGKAGVLLAVSNRGGAGY